jgi:hypothetical protein
VGNCCFFSRAGRRPDRSRRGEGNNSGKSKSSTERRLSKGRGDKNDPYNGQEGSGDILTKVAIPRSGSFLNTAGLARYKSRATRRNLTGKNVNGSNNNGGGELLLFFCLNLLAAPSTSRNFYCSRHLPVKNNQKNPFQDHRSASPSSSTSSDCKRTSTRSTRS